MDFHAGTLLQIFLCKGRLLNNPRQVKEAAL